MKRAQRVRMVEVAKRAGVAQPTVSIVLSGRQDIHIPEKTRVRILNAARELNYRLHGTARNLATGKTDTIAFVYDISAGSLLEDPFSRGIFSGVIGSSEAEKISVIFSTYGEDSKSVQVVEKRLVDGVLYLAAKQPEAVPYFENAGCPFVLLNPDVPHPKKTAAVILDDEKAGKLAAAQIAKTGHRNVLFVLASWKGRVPPSYRARAEAFKKILPKTELRTLALAGTLDDSYRLGWSAAQDIGDATAVVGVNDPIAWGLMDALCQKGIPVPEAVSVVGFDGLQRVFCSPGPVLSTVAFDHASIGRTGLKLLHKLLLGGKPTTLKIAPFWRKGETLKSPAKG